MHKDSIGQIETLRIIIIETQTITQGTNLGHSGCYPLPNNLQRQMKLNLNEAAS